MRNERLEGESFDDYKHRRKVEQHILKYRLRGAAVLWDSRKGPYVKEQHGDLYEQAHQEYGGQLHRQPGSEGGTAHSVPSHDDGEGSEQRAEASEQPHQRAGEEAAGSGSSTADVASGVQQSEGQTSQAAAAERSQA